MAEYRKHWAWDMVWAGVSIGVLLVAAILIVALKQGARVSVRNFYGGLRIVDHGGTGPEDARRTMVHGTISHGLQFLSPARRREGTTYYAPGSGVQTVLRAFERPGMRVGIVGLGAGTLAVYARPGDTYRFYEINPQVAHLARTEFTFLADAQGSVDVVLGDGRLALEREPPGSFDVLAIDAFSGDSIPVHLLTREAIQLYLSRVAEDGAVVLHISNTALRIAPVVQSIAAHLGRQSVVFQNSADSARGSSDSEWILVGNQESLHRRPALLAAGRRVAAVSDFPVWTDDYSNLFRILR
jgi:hypothetical protein